MLDDVKDYYRALWGEPSREAWFCMFGCEIELYKWDADANPEAVAIYATIGASVYPLDGFDPNHRVEFFTELLPVEDRIAKPFSMLAMEPGLYGTGLERGHVLTHPEPLWPETPMHSFLILGSSPNVLPSLELIGGLHVEFLQTAPVFPSEVKFIRENGSEALMQLWRVERVEFWNPYRLPNPPE